jgi:uncharacterized protein
MIPVSFKTISERLKEMQLPGFDLVIGIGTGGIVPASLVAFHLNTELMVMILNYRDEQNNPQYDNPVVISIPDKMTLPDKRILIVDDVSVTGKTLQKARELLSGYDVTTLTMKGIADFVLFPEIKDCVRWPWKP